MLWIPRRVSSSTTSRVSLNLSTMYGAWSGKNREPQTSVDVWVLIESFDEQMILPSPELLMHSVCGPVRGTTLHPAKSKLSKSHPVPICSRLLIYFSSPLPGHYPPHPPPSSSTLPHTLPLLHHLLHLPCTQSSAVQAAHASSPPSPKS